MQFYFSLSNTQIIVGRSVAYLLPSWVGAPAFPSINMNPTPSLTRKTRNQKLLTAQECFIVVALACLYGQGHHSLNLNVLSLKIFPPFLVCCGWYLCDLWPAFVNNQEKCGFVFFFSFFFFFQLGIILCSILYFIFNFFFKVRDGCLFYLVIVFNWYEVLNGFHGYINFHFLFSLELYWQSILVLFLEYYLQYCMVEEVMSGRR